MTDSVAADGQTPITGALQGVAGSSSAPGWTFHADTTSGLYSAAVGELGIVAAAFGMLVNSNAFAVSAVSSAAAGSGYAVGDTIVIAGGTGVLRAILMVATLSGSGVATATVLVGGNYSIAPTSPASQFSTSGSGTGATFTLTTVAADEISDLNGAALWTEFGATSYMAGSMTQPNGLGLANYIGSANLAAAVQSSLPLPVPQGRLTPITNTPVLTSDASASSQIFYTPSAGLWNPIHNGTTIIPYQLSGQLTLQLTSAQAVNNIYDVFLAYNAGTPVIGTGPSWSAGTGGSITPGSCARGTGAGGTALARLNGINTNAATVSLTWNTGSGNNTLSVAANQGIYLGSLYMDNTAGQASCLLSQGQNRKFGVWNSFNRVPIEMLIGDPTASWQYNSATVRASDAVPATYSANAFNVGSGTTCNGGVLFSGLAEEPYSVDFRQILSSVNTVASPVVGNGWEIGIGFNSTTAFTGKNGEASMASVQWLDEVNALARLVPSLGINNVCCLESSSHGTSAFFYGTSASMVMTAMWRG